MITEIETILSDGKTAINELRATCDAEVARVEATMRRQIAAVVTGEPPEPTPERRGPTPAQDPAPAMPAAVEPEAAAKPAEDTAPAGDAVWAKAEKPPGGKGAVKSPAAATPLVAKTPDGDPFAPATTKPSTPTSTPTLTPARSTSERLFGARSAAGGT